jgi:dihydroorotate dehydrogenase
MDPEEAHEFAVSSLALLGRISPLCRLLEVYSQVPRLRPIKAFGLDFPNAIGMAAGFDKNGKAWPAAAALGFGHVEIGTVTALEQPGNAKPRLFRYPSQKAVINRMGFNNDGSRLVAERLSQLPLPGKRRIPVGVNLGKSKVVSIDQATEDYLVSFNTLAAYADYIVLNVSSPNTPNLRALQDEDKLRQLLEAVTSANKDRQLKTGGKHLPILLKIAPDLTFTQIDTVLANVEEFKLDGLIATNTTLARPGYFQSISEAGGLSGTPLRKRATEIVAYISKATRGKLPLIAVGGIDSAESAAEKLDAGATLVQLYTGLIYKGPFYAGVLARALAARQKE